MSKSRGEARSKSEKGQRVLITPEQQKINSELKRQEEKEWAAKCGPVIIK